MSKILSKDLPKHFWTEESGLTSMLVLLCISNFIIIPFFEKGQLLNMLIRFIWLALLFAGISTLSETRMQRRIFTLFPILLIIVNVIRYFREGPVLDYADFATGIAVITLLIGMVFVKVFEKGPVTFHRIVGAVAGYMLIGNLWADMFQFLYIHLPGSLQLAASDAGSVIRPSTFIYFSYTTLTTTGFGDILPMHTVARTLVIIEQLIGVFYPAVLIGRLVSLTVESSHSKPSRQAQKNPDNE
jgi:hypothetical protein